MRKMRFISLVVLVQMLMILAACGPAPTPVVIEKEKVIEKQVVQTVEVVVTAIPPSSVGALQRVKDRGVLFVGFNFEPPYDYITPDGKFTGLDIEYTRLCAERIGIKEIKGVQTPWDGLIPGLLAEHYNVISAGMARRPARMEVVDFSDAVYFFGPHLMVLKGNPKDLHSWEDIAAKKVNVASVMGSTDLATCTDTYKLGDLCHGYQEYPQMVADLKAGRLDAIVQAELTQRAYLASTGDADVELVKDWVYPETSRVGIAFRKEDTDLRDAFNSCIAEIKKDGSLAKILVEFGLSADNIIEGVE